MNVRKLFVIGNGFDLHHGIPSSYSSFRDFLCVNDRNLYRLAEEYFDAQDLWSDFEATLAFFDEDYLKENASDFLESYGSDNWKESCNHDYQHEIEEVVTFLTIKLKSRFTEWILQLEVPIKSSIGDKYLNYINSEALFLTFNYTATLQELYGVSDDNIHYIHNKADDEFSELILGHAWNPKERTTSLNRKSSDDDDDDDDYVDFRINEGNKIIEEYFISTYKPTSEIIKNNKDFFDGLQLINEIYVLGHSISDVDIEYFKIIVKSTNSKSTKWRISYYNNDELNKLKKTMRTLEIEEKLITFSTLSELGNS